MLIVTDRVNEKYFFKNLLTMVRHALFVTKTVINWSLTVTVLLISKRNKRVFLRSLGATLTSQLTRGGASMM